MGDLRVGTSGYAYKEWRGSFYPEKLPDGEMLRFYSRQMRSVEINHTFYRMPTEKVLEGWAESVPAGFHFVLKANQKITHIQKLRDCEETVRRFLEAASVLARRELLGPILFQLPPTFRADAALLEDFLRLRPRAFRFALEVRHPSWHSDETYALLRRHGAALCLAETEKGAPPEVTTADFVYVRLRRPSYTPKELAAWKARCQSWQEQGLDVYLFFKHEEAGQAPAYARRLLAS
jgi:uncharacterized protein YecE (DUF72 family)